MDPDLRLAPWLPEFPPKPPKGSKLGVGAAGVGLGSSHFGPGSRDVQYSHCNFAENSEWQPQESGNETTILLEIARRLLKDELSILILEDDRPKKKTEYVHACKYQSKYSNHFHCQKMRVQKPSRQNYVQ